MYGAPGIRRAGAPAERTSTGGVSPCRGRWNTPHRCAPAFPFSRKQKRPVERLVGLRVAVTAEERFAEAPSHDVLVEEGDEEGEREETEGQSRREEGRSEAEERPDERGAREPDHEVTDLHRRLRGGGTHKGMTLGGDPRATTRLLAGKDED